jgi:hypothetical protein
VTQEQLNDVLATAKKISDLQAERKKLVELIESMEAEKSTTEVFIGQWDGFGGSMKAKWSPESVKTQLRGMALGLIKACLHDLDSELAGMLPPGR